MTQEQQEQQAETKLTRAERSLIELKEREARTLEIQAQNIRHEVMLTLCEDHGLSVRANTPSIRWEQSEPVAIVFQDLKRSGDE